LDVKMQVEGPTVLRRISDSGAGTRVVFLSAYLDSALIYSALESGAVGFLSKRADREEICDALRAAAKGQIVLSSESQTALGREIRFKKKIDTPVLTHREQEVLALAAEGLSATAIGKKLFLSSSTVKTHLAHLYDKLAFPTGGSSGGNIPSRVARVGLPAALECRSRAALQLLTSSDQSLQLTCSFPGEMYAFPADPGGLRPNRPRCS
jgi:DNA-binding NarL/FixJ family response regulator